MHLAGLQRDARHLAGQGDVFEAGFLQEQVDDLRGQLGAAVGFAVQAAQQALGGLGALDIADQFELVAAVADLDGQALFDQAQMLVELSAEVGEAACFEGFQDEAMVFQGSVQGLLLAAIRLSDG
ncbi:hypothetical protein D3C78_1160750 [compost metagenome]